MSAAEQVEGAEGAAKAHPLDGRATVLMLAASLGGLMLVVSQSLGEGVPVTLVTGLMAMGTMLALVALIGAVNMARLGRELSRLGVGAPASLKAKAWIIGALIGVSALYGAVAWVDLAHQAADDRDAAVQQQIDEQDW